MAENVKKETLFSQSLASQAVMQADGKRIFNWNATPQDTDLINRIKHRAVAMFGAGVAIQLSDGSVKKIQMNDGGRTFAMDLTCVHLNHKPLKLYSLLMCSDSDFLREFIGFSFCWNRHEGVFMNGFKSQFLTE